MPFRRLSSKAADAALTDLGDGASAGRDIWPDDELLSDLVSGQSLSLAL
jgi:hypothetical protein